MKEKEFYSNPAFKKFPIPADEDSLLNIDGIWTIPEGCNLMERKPHEKTILYIHGGGFASYVEIPSTGFLLFFKPIYCRGDITISRGFASRISTSAKCPILSINYRLAPEHPFPAALHDVFSSFLYLINPSHPAFNGPNSTIMHSPILPKDVILMGDSAGGCLVLNLIEYLKNFLVGLDGKPVFELPGGCITFSPWIDLSFSSNSWFSNAPYDWIPGRTRELVSELFHFHSSYFFLSAYSNHSENVDKERHTARDASLHPGQ
jgi:acetyl esterase/lipase